MNKFLVLFIVFNFFSIKSYAFDMFDGDNGAFFEDQTPVQPIDGNHGETLGEQRTVAALYIEDFLKSIFNSYVPIKIRIDLDTLSPNILASASPYYHFDQNTVPNLPLSGVYYPEALANQYSGFDLFSVTPEIIINVGNNPSYYYGFSKPPLGKNHFMALILHEVFHGMGFYDNVDSQGGIGFIPNKGLPYAPTVWDTLVWDESFYLSGIFMWFLYTPTDMQIATQVYGIDRLWFNGWNTKSQVQYIRNNSPLIYDYSQSNAVPVQLFNTNGVGYNSNHYSKSFLFNHEVMEPIDDSKGPYNHIGLAKHSLQDLGWLLHTNGDSPVISDIKDTISAFLSDTYDMNITQFAVWDNDNEVHLVNNYGFPASTNPWHPWLYVAVSASSSNQSVLADSEFTVYCALPNAGSLNENCEIFDLDISAGSGSAGSTVITINALDNAGNTDSESFILNLSTNTDPQIEISSPADGHIFLTSQPTLSVIASDVEDGLNLPVDWCYRIIGYDWLCYNSIPGDLTLSAIDGEYQVAACITDSDNNAVCDGITVTVAALADFDNDGIDNSTEVSLGTDPYNNDTDDDGLLDGSDPEPLVPQSVEIEIPAMGSIGLLALGLSMLGLGAVKLRKKK